MILNLKTNRRSKTNTLMKLTKKTIDLICELEKTIGDSCYNPESVNGWTLEEGCSFRYPVTYEAKDGKECKTRCTITDMDKNRINSVRYKFGANNLFIGNAIIKVLERLERKYNISFDELVKQ